MLKVLLCAPFGGVTGGISRWTEHVINYYNSLNVKEVDLILQPMGRSGFIPSYTLVHRLSSGSIEFTKMIFSYIRSFNSFKPDIVHISSSASISLLKDIVILRYARKRKVKTVLHFHFGRIPSLAERKNWEWKLIKYCIKSADIVLVIDKISNKALINKGFTNIRLLPNPISPDILNLIEKNKNIKRVKNRILFVGWVVKQKGIFELVQACRDIPDIHLKIIGPVIPEIKEKLLLDAKRDTYNKWIEFTGVLSLNDVIKEMLAASLFVLPSYSEGFPNVILESMACGCPIVASSVGAIPEMLADGSGLLIAPADVFSLREGIIKMLNDIKLAEEYGNNAKKSVESHYSMPKVWLSLNKIWMNDVVC